MTIGGFSILDFANLSNTFTTFIVYQMIGVKRGAALSQDRMIAEPEAEI